MDIRLKLNHKSKGICHQSTLKMMNNTQKKIVVYLMIMICLEKERKKCLKKLIRLNLMPKIEPPSNKGS